MKSPYLMVSIFVCSILIACAGTPGKNAGSGSDGKLITPQNLSEINGIEWNLTKMTRNNAVIALVKDSQTTFACAADGSVTGKATLNRYAGSLKLQHDGEITWSKAFIMTQMAGEPELMEQETNFSQALVKTSRMYSKDSKLILKNHDGSTILKFEQIK
jgi:heat shock protein HslJ